VYDLNLGLYRVRELTQEPLDFTALRFGSEQEKIANTYLELDKVKITTRIDNDQLYISGKIKGNSETFSTMAVIDKDQRLTEGSCTCAFYSINKLKKGPCEHILATRMKLHAGAPKPTDS